MQGIIRPQPISGVVTRQVIYYVFESVSGFNQFCKTVKFFKRQHNVRKRLIAFR